MMTMMMMMVVMMMICFCGMVDRQKMFSLISILDHWQRFSPSQICDTSLAGFELVQNLSSGFVDCNYEVVITATTAALQALFSEVLQQPKG